MKKLIMCCLLVIALTTFDIRAVSPPDLINYQGVLRDSADNPLDGNYDMTFKFFQSESAVDHIMTDSHTGALSSPVVVSNGLFNVKLGSGALSDGPEPGTHTNMSAMMKDFGSVWLEVWIGGESLSPRVQLVSSAYALNADNLDGMDYTEFAFSSHDHDTRYYTQTELASSGSSQVDWGNLISVPSGFADGVDDVGSADNDWTVSGSYIYSDSAYNIGIGTSVPGHSLDVNGDFALSGALRDGTGNAGVSGQVIQSTGTGIEWVDGASGSDSDWIISGTDMYSGVSGNIGIGTSNPLNHLDIDGRVAIGNNYPGNYTAPSGGLIIEGDVGIGTTAPGHKLDVVGSLRLQSGNLQLTDNAVINVAGDPANLRFEGNNLELYFGEDALCRSYFKGDVEPYSLGTRLGRSTHYWERVYAETYYGKSTSIVAFDTYDDLDLLDQMKMKSHTDNLTGETILIFDPETIPPMIKADNEAGGEKVDEFVDIMKAIGFAYGSLRQMRQEVRDKEEELYDEINERTPDIDTGEQSLSGNLQLMLDSDSNDRSRFSVFRDGSSSVLEEIFRLDENGNLKIKGTLMPNSLDLAEYHPVSHEVEVGDVLVIDKERVGHMKKCAVQADKSVVGIVSEYPGIALGAGIDRTIRLFPDEKEEIDYARGNGDMQLEQAIWEEIERKFNQTHAPITLSGAVLCKVDAGYGEIEAGDILTTSPNPGYAMISHFAEPGTIVGKALEPLENGTGLIKVIVMLR